MILQSDLSREDWLSRGRLLIEKYGGSSQGMYWTPFRPLVTKLVDWMTHDSTSNIAYRFYRRARLIPALLTCIERTDIPEAHKSIMGALMSLILRIGDEVVRELDFYGARSLIRNISGTSVMREASGVLAAMASVDYFRTLPVMPIFPSNFTLFSSPLSELDHYTENLSGMWHLIVVDASSMAEPEYEHAVCELKFGAEDGTLEGHGVGTLGPFLLTPGKGCYSIDSLSIFFTFTPEPLVFEGTAMPMGWCGTYGFAELSKKAKTLEQYMGQSKSSSSTKQNSGSTKGSEQPELLTNTDFQPRGGWILCRSPGDFAEAEFKRLFADTWKRGTKMTKDAKVSEAAAEEEVEAGTVAELEKDVAQSGNTEKLVDERNDEDEENITVSTNNSVIRKKKVKRSEWMDHIRNASKGVFLLTLPELSVNIINDIQAYYPPISEATTQRMKSILPPLPVQPDEPEQSYKRRQAQFPITCGTLHDLRRAMVGEYTKEEVDADIAILRYSLGKEESVNKQNVIFCAALNRWYQRLHLSAFESYGSIPSVLALVQFLEEAQQQLQANGRKTFMTDSTVHKWSDHFISHGSFARDSAKTNSSHLGDEDAGLDEDDDYETDEDVDSDDPFKSRLKRRRAGGSTSGTTVLLLSAAAIAIGAIVGGAFMLGRRSKKTPSTTTPS